MTESVDLYGMLYALKERIRAELYNDFQKNLALAQIRDMHSKATAYAWGREDAGDRRINYVYNREIIDASWEFGHMVGIMVAMSYLGDRTMSHAPNLRHSWAAFRASRDLREYVHEERN